MSYIEDALGALDSLMDFSDSKDFRKEEAVGDSSSDNMGLEEVKVPYEYQTLDNGDKVHILKSYHSLLDEQRAMFGYKEEEFALVKKLIGYDLFFENPHSIFEDVKDVYISFCYTLLDQDYHKKVSEWKEVLESFMTRLGYRQFEGLSYSEYTLISIIKLLEYYNVSNEIIMYSILDTGTISEGRRDSHIMYVYECLLKFIEFRNEIGVIVDFLNCIDYSMTTLEHTNFTFINLNGINLLSGEDNVKLNDSIRFIDKYIKVRMAENLVRSIWSSADSFCNSYVEKKKSAIEFYSILSDKFLDVVSKRVEQEGLKKLEDMIWDEKIKLTNSSNESLYGVFDLLSNYKTLEGLEECLRNSPYNSNKDKVDENETKNSSLKSTSIFD